MKRETFLHKISTEKPLTADGAMGTILHDRGIGFDACFDALNQTNPVLVGEIHHAYIESGAQIILTNTFGSNRYKLAQHGLEDQVAIINIAGVELARKVVNSFEKDILIGGDVGPLGVRLAPFGRVQPEDAQEAFAEQISALLSAGVDLLVIETLSDLYEIREAVAAARILSPDVPIVASMTFTRDDRTLLGDDPAKVARKIIEYGADVIGVNCSGGPNQLLRIIKNMRRAQPDAYFWVKPNAGWPEQISGRIFYPASADYFGDYALSFWQAGARVIGGCCGTTPAHVAAIRNAIDRNQIEDLTNGLSFAAEVEEEEQIKKLTPTRLARKLAAGEFVYAVEMDPPRGLSTHKMIAGASLLSEAGADVIDVADSPMARMRMSPWAVCALIQKQVKIETTLHFPTRGRNLLRVQGDLLAAHALGVRNVFVIMGDPTAIGDYPDAMDNYDLAPSGLIKLIKQGFNLGLDHAGGDIGQPTSFFVGCALNLTAPDIARECELLHRKIRAGADFILTQPIYSKKPLETFQVEYEKRYQKIPIPVLAGILPLASDRHAAFLQQEVPGIDIPDAVHAVMRAAGDNGASEGIRLSVELIKQMRAIASGVYLMPAFGRFDYAARIIEESIG